MWFALGTPVFLMVGAVLMERVEQHCAEVPARSRVAVAEPAREREVARPLVVVGNAAVWS
jgi:hypothetical protein